MPRFETASSNSECWPGASSLHKRTNDGAYRASYATISPSDDGNPVTACSPIIDRHTHTVSGGAPRCMNTATVAAA